MLDDEAATKDESAHKSFSSFPLEVLTWHSTTHGCVNTLRDRGILLGLPNLFLEVKSIEVSCAICLDCFFKIMRGNGGPPA